MGYQILSRCRSELMGAAMLWVMLFHAADLDMGLPALELIRAAGFGGVDIFILLSAMGLVLSLSRREQDYAAFMARRARRLLPAYYAVMLPYTLFLILTQGVPWAALVWNSTLLYYWVHCAGAFNWYVAGAMTFYAVTPLCFRRLRDSGHRTALTGAGIAAGLAVCQVLVREEYWEYTDFWFRVPVFFLGLLMGFFVLEERRLGRRDLLFWGLWLAAGLLYLAAAFRLDQDLLALPLCHLFLFTTVPLCLFLCLCLERLPLEWLRRFLRILGENSLEIYLLNVSLFAQLAPPRDWAASGAANRLFYLLLFAANIALGVLLSRLVRALRPGNRQTSIQ